MRFLGIPSDSTLELYKACSSGVGSKEQKDRLANYIERVVNASDIYKLRCEDNQLHILIREYVAKNKLHTVPYVSKKEFKLLYEYQTQKDRPGRDIYNRLIVTPQRRCPFCSVGTVKNLDHFIPKAHFPVFAVTPLNLVPSCRDCNMDKKSDFSTEIREQTLHPYFDNVSDVQWLFAEVVDESLPPVIEYFVDASSIQSSALASKVEAHFSGYDLGNIFMDQAAVRTNEIQLVCKERFDEEGAEGLKFYLEEQKESAEKTYKNSWTVAMFGALSSSKWYCEEAFQEAKSELEQLDELQKVCEICKGKTVLDCQFCKPYHSNDCKVCSGTFTMTSSDCPECHGLGFIECN